MMRFLLMVGVVASLTTGCKSVPEQSKAHCADIVVKSCSAEQIEAKTKAVFEKHGYETAKPEGEVLVFQRPGGFWKSAWYGDWYNGEVWERVRVYRSERGPGETVVDCDRFMVQQHEDPLFQKEQQVKGKNSDCQKLLEEVAGELKR